MTTVTCATRECENVGVDIIIKEWDGSTIVCGPCGTVLEPQAEWYAPPEPDDPVQTAAQAIARLTTEERAALISLLAVPGEEETT